MNILNTLWKFFDRTSYERNKLNEAVCEASDEYHKNMKKAINDILGAHAEAMKELNK